MKFIINAVLNGHVTNLRCGVKNVFTRQDMQKPKTV